MFWGNSVESLVDRAFQLAPKALYRVGVRRSLNVLVDRVVNAFVVEAH